METWCKGGEIGDAVLRGGARVRYLRVGSKAHPCS
jgi:hypothetical protein